MQDVDLQIVPRWIVPVEPHLTVHEDHALVVDGGRIVDLLPADFARQAYRARETLELPNQVVLPGLVNTHTHAAMTLLRGLADDLPLMSWLQDHIWPAEGRHASAAFCRAGVALAAAEMLKGGITCFADQYFFPESTVEVLRDASMRALVGVPVLEFPTPWAQNAQGYISRAVDVIEANRTHPLLGFAFAPHAPYTVGDPALERIAMLSHEMDVPIHMHVHETAFEVEDAVAQHGERPFARLKRLGLLSREFMAVHMTQLNGREIEDCATFGVSIAHCPESNLKLASGFCPVSKLLDAGVNVSIGTDGAASNNDLDLIGEMRTAALLAKGVSGNAAAFPAAQALRAATLGGARALGLEEQIGSLEPGKAADFIAIDMDQIDSVPMYDLISQIVYATGRDRVTHSYVAGRALMRGRELQTLDESAIKAEARQWQQRIIEGLQA